MPRDYNAVCAYDLCGRDHKALLNTAYKIEFWFLPEAERGPSALYHFDLINSTETRPVRVQLADAVDFAHAQKMALCFLRHWSEHHVKFGDTGVVPPEELAA